MQRLLKLLTTPSICTLNTIVAMILTKKGRVIPKITGILKFTFNHINFAKRTELIWSLSF